MPYRPRAGKASRVLIGSTPLFMTDWSVDDTGGDLDTTTFESGGFETGTIGILVASFNFNGYWNAGANVTDNPPGVYPRDDLGPISLVENVTDNNGWLFTLARIISATNSTNVKDLVKFQASTCKSNGSYSRPTGSSP